MLASLPQNLVCSLAAQTTHNSGTRASGLTRLGFNVKGIAIFLADHPFPFLLLRKHLGTLSCLCTKRKVTFVNKSFQTHPRPGGNPKHLLQPLSSLEVFSPTCVWRECVIMFADFCFLLLLLGLEVNRFQPCRNSGGLKIQKAQF